MSDQTCPDAPLIEMSLWFLKWKEKQDCFYEPVNVSNWGSGKYEVTGKCKFCGNRRRAFGLELRDLKKWGLRAPSASEYYFGYDPRKENKEAE